MLCGLPQPVWHVVKMSDMRSFLNITKALADETRLRILMALRHGEMCACQIIALLELAPSTVSRHLYLLTQARLIEKRKCGKWIYCRLPAAAEAPSPEVRSALAMTCAALSGNERIAKDDVNLVAIKAMSLEEVCCPLNEKRRGASCR